MNTQRKGGNRQAGFSLLELTVTMGIMVIILGVVSKLMADALRTSTLVNETTEAQQSLRAAHKFMGDDLLVVGDGLNGLVSKEIQVPLNFVTTNITASPNDRRINANPNASYVPLPLVTADDDQSRGGGVPSLLPTTDRVTLMTEVTDASFPVSILSGDTTTFTKPNANSLVVKVPTATATLFRPGEVVLVVSSVAPGNAVFATVSAVATAAPAKITFTSGDGYGLNTTGLPLLTNMVWPSGYSALTAGSSITVMRVNLITYFVAADGLLRRRVLGNPRVGNVTESDFVNRAMAGEVIAEHVSELQVRYGVVNPANRGTWDHVDKLTLAQQPMVREVEVTATAETPHQIVNGTERGKVTSVARTSVRTMEYRNAL